MEALSKLKLFVNSIWLQHLEQHVELNFISAADAFRIHMYAYTERTSD